MATLAGAEHLTDDRAGQILGAALGAAGTPLRSWRMRDVHRRGRSLSVVYEAAVTGFDHDVLLVAHVSERSVPPGAAQVSVDGATVHVWRFPHDPYLPGLPSAVSPERVGALLDGLGVQAAVPRLRTRSYRPTRRAVVEVTVARPRGRHRVLYLKALGGRTVDRVRERTTALAAVHRDLADAGLPVPAVVGTATGQGLVALAARPGVTLHRCLLDALPLPPVGQIVDLTRRLWSTPLRSGGDPRGFARSDRHVPLLAEAGSVPRSRLLALAEEADRAAGPTGTVHGDLHDGQLLVVDGALDGLLDVDGAGTGLCVHDAGRLVAYVGAVADVRPAAGQRAGELGTALFEAYAGILPEAELRRAVAGAWISLATGPVRSRGEGWRDAVRERIDRAEAWLSGGPTRMS